MALTNHYMLISINDGQFLCKQFTISKLKHVFYVHVYTS